MAEQIKEWAQLTSYRPKGNTRLYKGERREYKTNSFCPEGKSVKHKTVKQYPDLGDDQNSRSGDID